MKDANEIIRKMEDFLSSQKSTTGKRKNSDEAYIIDLCDEVLNLKASRQHRFHFLQGDTSPKTGKKVELPVDAYYKKFKLVVEYNERQHTEEVDFFDKKKTVSGVSRGEQRRIYDERRKKVLPEHGIDLVIISYSDFGTSKKLQRNHDRDLQVVKRKLEKYIAK